MINFLALKVYNQQLLKLGNKLNEDLKDRFVVALKVDKEANAGLVSDIKQELRKMNALKVMYVTGVGDVE